jgi:threonine dehydratase
MIGMTKQIDQFFSRKAIDTAHLQIEPYIEKTAVLTSRSINKVAGCNIYFKCENFQKIGAFKMRGATHALIELKKKEQDAKVVTHSSGNHAQAVAKAAQMLRMKAFIVMPNNAPKIKIEGVKAFGAKITFCEPNLRAREDKMREIADREHAVFIPPYDHLDVILGQATAAKELLQDFPKLDAVICPVGGGGLLAGSALSAHYYGDKCLVYGAEPLGADDAFQSFKTGELIPQTKPKTIADGLLTSLGKLNFKVIQQLVDDILLVNDHQIKSAMRLIWERLKIIVEPSCAVPLAAVLNFQDTFKDQEVGIILSGGNVDLDNYFDQLQPIT